MAANEKQVHVDRSERAWQGRSPAGATQKHAGTTSSRAVHIMIALAVSKHNGHPLRGIAGPTENPAAHPNAGEPYSLDLGATPGLPSNRVPRPRCAGDRSGGTMAFDTLARCVQRPFLSRRYCAIRNDHFTLQYSTLSFALDQDQLDHPILPTRIRFASAPRRRTVDTSSICISVPSNRETLSSGCQPP